MTFHLLKKKTPAGLANGSKARVNISPFPHFCLFIPAMRQYMLKAKILDKIYNPGIMPRNSWVGFWLCLPPERTFIYSRPQNHSEAREWCKHSAAISLGWSFRLCWLSIHIGRKSLFLRLLQFFFITLLLGFHLPPMLLSWKLRNQRLFVFAVALWCLEQCLPHNRPSIKFVE